MSVEPSTVSLLHGTVQAGMERAMSGTHCSTIDVQYTRCEKRFSRIVDVLRRGQRWTRGNEGMSERARLSILCESEVCEETFEITVQRA
jgi:hypothetical protein